MRTLTTIALTSLFWFGSLAIIAGAFIVGSYQAGNVLHIVNVPRENTVFVADDAAIERINMATQDTFPYAKGR